MVGSYIASRLRKAREAEVVEEACCIAYPACTATASPGQHDSTEVDTAGCRGRSATHTSTRITKLGE